MKKNFIQKLLSYFIDIPLENIKSDITGELEISLSRGRIQLSSHNATYSFEDLYSSFAHALKRIEPNSFHIKNILVLGLGLGSIPYLLQKKYHINTQIDCIEFDPVIIALAKKYYPLQNHFHLLHITQTDAFDWMIKNKKQYDLILIDLFIDSLVPPKFHEAIFMKSIINSLRYNGEILFSRIKRNHDIEKLLWENLENCFPNANEIEVNGNMILHWTKINN